MRAKKITIRKPQQPKITLERFAEALLGTYGNLTAIAARLHVSRTTVYKFLQDHPDASSLLTESRESFDDIAESILQKRIVEGSERLLEFYAKTKMKHRGYSESLDLNVLKMPELKIILSE